MNRLYKFQISAPTTADKVKGLEVIPNISKGMAFRIEKAWISFPDRDAIASTDAIGFQISTKNQDEAAAFYEVDSEYEVYTFYMLETFTQDDRGLAYDPNTMIPLSDIEGTILKSGNKYFLNAIVTGQDAADVECHVKLLGQYVNPKQSVDDWHDNSL